MVQTTSAGLRADRKRAEILRRAAEVFRRKGFRGAGMREIATGLGLAPGALYYYFESKEDLLHACQRLSLERLTRSASEIAADAHPPAGKLRRLVLAHLSHVLGELGGSFAHVEFHALPDAQLAEVVGWRDAYERIVRGVIEDGIRAGAFRAVDGKLATLALLGALNWAAVWWRPDGPLSVADVAERTADLFLKGLER
ncbi:MAG: TetR/AcrR family transcriptional regulator [Planctomycetes bacterium]|nr:TetR/AcrR family transcriptional regulator [Planctomycetota bacterium]